MDSQIPAPRIQRRDARSALIWGFILIVVGGTSLVGQFRPDAERYIPLCIGLALLVIFAVGRSYLALVGAGIMTGLGIGIVVADMFPAQEAAPGAAVTLGLGVGFISVWVIAELMQLGERHFWPLVPGTILSLVGVGLALDLFTQDWSGYVIPAIVLGLGLVFMVVGYVRLDRDRGGAAA